MAELIIQPHNKAGGRSVSISEERQFGVSAIYRSGYTCTVRHLTFYRSVSISKKETVRMYAIYSKHRSISIREERQFEVSTTYRSVSISEERPQSRVSSKQTKINFGSNRNKPKQDLFRVCFGLFRETQSKKFRFVSVFRTYIETTETNRTVS
jgi:hypothetical protein